MSDELDERLCFLLDAPTGAAPAKVQIAKIAEDLRDPRYGTFAITPGEVDRWSKNLSKLPGGRALIDTDHSADRSGPARNTEAAGWITAISLDDGVPMADVEWTPIGRDAIKEKRYLFFSPVFGKYRDEHGTVHDDVLTGGALTNKPFLNMPVISLASAPAGDGPWHPGAYMLEDGTYAPSDSRRQMAQDAPTVDLKKLATALSLDEGADEAKILDAITELQKPESPTKQLAAALGLDEAADEAKILDAIKALQAEPAKDATDPAAVTKTLEQQATEAGKVLLDAAKVEAMNTAASEVPTLKATLKELTDERVEARFDAAWNKALEDFRAAPAERDFVRELYDIDAEKTLKMLDARPKIVNDRRHGSGNADAATPPDGVDPNSWALNQRVQAFMLEKGEKDYIKALEAVQLQDQIGVPA